MNAGIRKPLPLIKPLNSSNSLGDNLVVAVLDGVGGVPTLVSPSLTNTSPIYDKYCAGPTSIQVQLDRSVSQTVIPVVSETLKLDVSYHVAAHAHTVPLHRHPQKKGLSPDRSLNRINRVATDTGKPGKAKKNSRYGKIIEF